MISTAEVCKYMEKIIKISGMACKRCLDIVRDIFEGHNFTVYYVKIGEVCYEENTCSSIGKAEELLKAKGFVFLTEKQSSYQSSETFGRK
jgi:hypothetical protein